MFIFNWTQIISNAITGAIQASFSAVAVYLAMKMINHAEFGHIGGSFSSVDILISLYNSGIFNFNKENYFTK